MTQMRMGGVSYEIEYDVAYSGSKETEFLHSYLPTDLVCSLVSNSYERPEWKQQVLDALSPFQIISKQWVCSVLSDVMKDSYERSPFVYFGSWFGQLNSLMSRRVQNYFARDVVMIDLDSSATEMSRRVLADDHWQLPSAENVKIITGDALAFDLAAFAEEQGAAPIVVWTGIEHFDPDDVKAYLHDQRESNAMYLLQGTNMPAPDHKALITSCLQLEQYFDGDTIYSAQLKTGIGSRFMTVFDT
jgi:hypothetical protein